MKEKSKTLDISSDDPPISSLKSVHRINLDRIICAHLDINFLRNKSDTFAAQGKGIVEDFIYFLKF